MHLSLGNFTFDFFLGEVLVVLIVEIILNQVNPLLYLYMLIMPLVISYESVIETGILWEGKCSNSIIFASFKSHPFVSFLMSLGTDDKNGDPYMG